MRKRLFSLLGTLHFVAAILPTISSAQTTEINYLAWIGSTNCNIFGVPTTVTGVQHKSTLGQPKYGSYQDPVILECAPLDFDHFEAKGTEYAISMNFLANHQYKVTVECASNATISAPRLALTYTNSIASSMACTGPSVDNDINAAGYVITGTAYYGFEYTNTIGVQSQSYLKLRAIAGYGGLTLQKIMIRRIVIQDITPSPPAFTFTLTSSASSKPCAPQGLDPITFTVNNVDNATGISGYTFYVEPGKWLMNDVPAGPTIPTTSNSITLTPVNCSSGANVYCKVGVGNYTYTSNTKNIAVRNPTYVISPPTMSSSTSASYDLLVSPDLTLFFPCPTSINWSISDLQVATLSTNTSGTSATVTRNNRGTGQGTIILTAAMNLCGETVTASRNVVVGPFGVMSGKIKSDDLSANNNAYGKLITGISPNPTSGTFVIDFNNEVIDADLFITAIDGKLIKRMKISGKQASVDLSAAVSGMYFIKVINGSNVSAEKVMKQ